MLELYHPIWIWDTVLLTPNNLLSGLCAYSAHESTSKITYLKINSVKLVYSVSANTRTIAGRFDSMLLVNTCWYLLPEPGRKKSKTFWSKWKEAVAVLGGLWDSVSRLHDWVGAFTSRTIRRAHWVNHTVFIRQHSSVVSSRSTGKTWVSIYQRIASKVTWSQLGHDYRIKW